VLQMQVKRLQWLAERRGEALGGAASVAVEQDGDTSAVCAGRSQRGLRAKIGDPFWVNWAFGDAPHDDKL